MSDNSRSDREINRENQAAEDERQDRDYDNEQMPNRATNDWLEAIGPEDESPRRKTENLEQYGWDPMGETHNVSWESAEEYPLWADPGAYEDVVEPGDTIDGIPIDTDGPEGEFRPTENEALDDLDEPDDER